MIGTRPTSRQQLDGVRAQPAHAPDPDGWPGRTCAGGGDRRPGGGDRVGDDRGLVEGERVGERGPGCRRGRRRTRPSRRRSRRRGCAPRRRAARPPAEPPAGRRPTRRRPVRPVDHPGHLMAEGHGVTGQEQGLEHPLDQVDVGQADPSRLDGDPDLPRPGLRVGTSSMTNDDEDTVSRPASMSAPSVRMECCGQDQSPERRCAAVDAGQPDVQQGVDDVPPGTWPTRSGSAPPR